MSNAETVSEIEAVPAQLTLDVVLEQRNQAMNDAASATARSLHFQNLNKVLKQQVETLQAELDKKKE